jgi:hypothetical protein
MIILGKNALETFRFSLPTKKHVKLSIASLALGLRPRQKGLKGTGQEECEKEDSHSQVSSPFGSWSPSGLPNLQGMIAKVKTPCIEEFFISLESY